MDQGRRLKRLTGGQPGSQPRSQAAQLSVKHRQQFSRGLLLLGRTWWIALRHWGKNFKFLGPPSAPFQMSCSRGEAARFRYGKRGR